MEQNETAIPIVFIRDSKHVSMPPDFVPASAETVGAAERAGIEEVITFLTQYSRPQR